MYLTKLQTFIMIIAVAAGTIITRFLPFALFPEDKEIPPVISFLAKNLPCAMMGLLVVYCLKEVSVMTAPFGIPELLGILTVAALHVWKSNTLLSIGGGSALYMFLVQVVF